MKASFYTTILSALLLCFMVPACLDNAPGKVKQRKRALLVNERNFGNYQNSNTNSRDIFGSAETESDAPPPEPGQFGSLANTAINSSSTEGSGNSGGSNPFGGAGTNDGTGNFTSGSNPNGTSPFGGNTASGSEGGSSGSGFGSGGGDGGSGPFSAGSQSVDAAAGSDGSGSGGNPFGSASSGDSNGLATENPLGSASSGGGGFSGFGSGTVPSGGFGTTTGGSTDANGGFGSGSSAGGFGGTGTGDTGNGDTGNGDTGNGDTNTTTAAVVPEEYTVTITTSATQYVTTDPFALSAEITPITIDGNKDIHIVVYANNATFFPLVIRDGAIIFGDVGTSEPLFANWRPSVIAAPDFFTLPSLAGSVPGNYSWRLILTQPGADVRQSENWVSFAEASIVVGAPEPPTLAVSISTDQPVYQGTDTLKLSSTITVSGSHTSKDLYVVAVSPAGHFYPLVVSEGVYGFGVEDSSEPMFPNWIPETIEAPDFFTLDALDTLPVGNYKWALILTESDANVMLVENWVYSAEALFEIQGTATTAGAETPPTMRIETDRATYSNTDALVLSADITLNGPLTAKDLYIVSFLPDGKFFCLTKNSTDQYEFAGENVGQALVANWVPTDVPAPNFFSLPSLASLTPGQYKWMVILTEPGADVAQTSNRIYLDEAIFDVEVAPAAATENSNMVLTISTDKDSYVATDAMTLSSTITVSGPQTPKEIHVAVGLPDGSFFSLIKQGDQFAFGPINVAQAMFPDWAPLTLNAPNFFTLPTLDGLVTGTYTWLIAITEVGVDAANSANWLYQAEKVVQVTMESITAKITTDRRAYPNFGRLGLNAEIAVTGVYSPKDVHVMVYAPDGTFYSLIVQADGTTGFSPVNVNTAMFSGWVPGNLNETDFYVIDSLQGMPVGSYYWQLVLTEVGANVAQQGNWIASDRWDFTVGQ